MEIGINLNSNRPCEEIAEAFLENGIKRTFVCVEHPRFDEAMTTLGKLNIKVENLMLECFIHYMQSCNRSDMFL